MYLRRIYGNKFGKGMPYASIVFPVTNCTILGHLGNKFAGYRVYRIQ